VAVIGAGAVLAGCSSPPDEGTVDGSLQAVGGSPGPATASPRPLSGTVTFHGSNGNIATLEISANGRFSVHLPVGRYTVAGRSPRFEDDAGECLAPGWVTVRRGVTSRAEVDCQER
jgi:hypothetical protein